MRPKNFPSIRTRLLLLTISYTLLISFLIVSVFYTVFQDTLRTNLIRSTEFNLELVTDNISNDLKEIINLTRWCCSNTQISEYLTSNDSNTKIQSLQTFNRLKEEYQNCKANDYIERILISRNDDQYLQICPTTYGSSDSAKIIRNSDFFEPLYTDDGFLWLGTVFDPFYPNQDLSILPIIRPIYSSHGTTVIGWVYIAIYTDIITDYLENYLIPSDSTLYLTIQDKTYAVQEKSLELTNETITSNHTLSGVTYHDSTNTYLLKNQTNTTTTFVSCTFDIDGWKLSQNISKSKMMEQRHYYLYILGLIAVCLLALALALNLFLNRTVNKPIAMIRNKIHRISSGDFSYDSSIEWNHELGEIGRGINSLSTNMIHLMENRIADEKQKKDLEYQILLNQVDPHFLYNTLNSIKWMATIQEATGIEEMTSALARLMKNISKGTHKRITIRDELSLLKDYFLIQQYRYGGMAKLECKVASDDLYDCQILRFTLQPLVENALFHGIEPTGKPGTIALSVEHPKEQLLLITIRDNGVGMTEEQIHQCLTENVSEPSGLFQKVGIYNVNKRIQFEFGTSHGIAIASIIGEFTEMKIYLPYLYQKNEGGSYD